MEPRPTTKGRDTMTTETTTTIEQDRIDARKYRALRLSLESFLRDTQMEMFLNPDPMANKDDVPERDWGEYEGRRWMDELWRGMIADELEELDERVK